MPVTGKSVLQMVREVAATATAQRIGLGKKTGKPTTDKSNPSTTITSAKQALKEMAAQGDYGRVTWETRLRGPAGDARIHKVLWEIECTARNLFDSHRETMGLQKFKIARENAFQYTVHCDLLRKKVSLPLKAYEFRPWQDLFEHFKPDFAERDVSRSHLVLHIQIQLDWESPEVDEEDEDLYPAPSVATRSKTAKRKELESTRNLDDSVMPPSKKQRPQPVPSQSLPTTKATAPNRKKAGSLVPSRTLSTASRPPNPSNITGILFRPSSTGTDGMLDLCSNLRENQRVTVSITKPPLEGAFKRCLDGEYEGERVAIVFCPQRTVPATPITPEESERVAGEVENECTALTLTDAVVKAFMKIIRANSTPSTLPGIKVNAGDSVFVVDFGAAPEFEIQKVKHKFYQHAILSPLLANWPNPFIKFSDASGVFQPWNPESGMAAEEWGTLSKMLAALTHFAWVNSGGSYIPVDLQGAWDQDRKQFTLSDIQLHTTTTFSDRSLSHWDHKEAGIAAFFDTHRECNVYCQVVGVVGKVFEGRRHKLAISELVH
ncbi:hypothetical protein FS837_003935 [Tulasnella sp. UAMH 9824]|nr:hypothetical protein FS837_003935 [Tulasnella sp. UAMH 9824]